MGSASTVKYYIATLGENLKRQFVVYINAIFKSIASAYSRELIVDCGKVPRRTGKTHTPNFFRIMDMPLTVSVPCCGNCNRGAVRPKSKRQKVF